MCFHLLTLIVEIVVVKLIANRERFVTLIKIDTNRRRAIPIETKVAIAITRLAYGFPSLYNSW